MTISVQDYNPDMVVELEDPTNPEETVEKKLMDKLAYLLTILEEMLLHGDSEMTVGQLLEFVAKRGDLLDELDDPAIRRWLHKMRETARCPHRRYKLG